MSSLLKAGRILEAALVPAAALFVAAILLRWHLAGWRVVGL